MICSDGSIAVFKNRFDTISIFYELKILEISITWTIFFYFYSASSVSFSVKFQIQALGNVTYFLLLARYVPNVAKRSIMKYMLTNDRPTTTHLGTLQMAICPRWITRFTPCLVLAWGFRGWQIEWRYFELNQTQ